MNSNKKRLLSIFIGLFLLIVAFFVMLVYFGGWYFDNFGETIIVMLVVSFVMMIVPVSIWMINHKHLGRKIGFRICAVNSLIIFILVAIWPIITLIKNKPCNSLDTICGVQFSREILGLALFLTIVYFVINICFWVDLRRIK